MNVYITVPGIDYNRTIGMCGDNNGNPNNDAPAYVINDPNLIPDSMKVNPQTDLWGWVPSNTATAATLPPFAEECSYTAPVVSKPLISYGSLFPLDYTFLFSDRL